MGAHAQPHPQLLGDSGKLYFRLWRQEMGEFGERERVHWMLFSTPTGIPLKAVGFKSQNCHTVLS